MQISLTSKVRILPDEDGKELLLSTMQAYTSACNYVSVHIFSTGCMHHRSLHDDLYYVLRAKFSLRSQMAESVIRTVLARYRSLDSSHKPWVLIRFNKPQYDLVWNRDYSLKGDTFSVNTLEGRKKFSSARPSSSLAGKLGTAKLVYRHGKFYLHISVTHDAPDISEEDISGVVGIDRGIRFLATAYDSNGDTSFFSGAAVKSKRAHYLELRRELQKVGTPSSRRRLKAIGQRENRWMRDIDHCISKALTESYPEGTMFVLEDLAGIRSQTERIKGKHRYISVSWPFHDLEQKIMYKAALKGQMVIKVDPAYTSQVCPVCGRRDKSSRDKANHLFRCRGCGYISNDDRIAAMNLHSMGMKYLVQCGKSMSLSAGAESTVPDVTPATQAVPVCATNAGGESRVLQGSHKPPLQGVSLSGG